MGKKMGKKITIVIATALTLCMLLVSCGGGGGGGGGVSAPASTSSTYSGCFSVNGGSYSSVALNSSDNTATVSGSSGTLTGTYTSGRSIADGIYTITFSDGHTIVITISGSSITLSAGTWSASGSGTLQTSSSGSGGGSSSGGNNTSSGNESASTAAAAQAIYNSLLGTHWKYEEVPLAQRGTSSDPLNSVGIPMPNGILYGYFDLTISANGILQLSGRFEYGDGTIAQEMHSSAPSSSGIEFFDTPHSFSIHIESASSRAAIFVDVNGHEERLGYINIGDSNGDGIYDTPREDTFNHEGTNHFFTRVN